jgi:hypothetical protein
VTDERASEKARPLGRFDQTAEWFDGPVEQSWVDRWLAHPAAWVMALVLLAALQASLILGHQAWLDEWQALAIAVQSPTIHDLFANLAYEGHPAAWYLLLRGLGTVVPDPRWTLAVAALALALVTQSTILFAAPFARFERLLIALSQFFLFEFLTISRSLTLGACTMVVATALWSRRRAVWLAIALLPQCDFLFGVLAIGLGFLRWRERRLWWPGVALLIASGAVAAWTVHPAADVVPALAPLSPLKGIGAWIVRTATVGLPLQWTNGQLTWNSAAPALVVPIGGILLYALVRRELGPHRDLLLVFVGFLAVTLGFSVMVYPLVARHMFLVGLLLIALLWLRTSASGRQPGKLFRLWLAGAAVCGLISAAVSAAKPFDTGGLAAHEIVKRGLRGKTWVALRKERGPMIAGLTGMAIQPYGEDCVGSFIRWNHANGALDADGIGTWLASNASSHGRFWLVSETPIDADRRFTQLLASFPAGYDGIPYFLYVVRPDLPDAPLPARRCDGPVLPYPARR